MYIIVRDLAALRANWQTINGKKIGSKKVDNKSKRRWRLTALTRSRLNNNQCVDVMAMHLSRITIGKRDRIRCTSLSFIANFHTRYTHKFRSYGLLFWLHTIVHYLCIFTLLQFIFVSIMFDICLSICPKTIFRKIYLSTSQNVFKQTWVAKDQQFNRTFSKWLLLQNKEHLQLNWAPLDVWLAWRMSINHSDFQRSIFIDDTVACRLHVRFIRSLLMCYNIRIECFWLDSIGCCGDGLISVDLIEQRHHHNENIMYTQLIGKDTTQRNEIEKKCWSQPVLLMQNWEVSAVWRAELVIELRNEQEKYARKLTSTFACVFVFIKPMTNSLQPCIHRAPLILIMKTLAESYKTDNYLLI